MTSSSALTTDPSGVAGGERRLLFWTAVSTAAMADTDSPYDLQHLAAAVGETATRLHHAVRDALTEVPDHHPKP